MINWYSNLKAEEFSGKHVRVILNSGTVIEGETHPVNPDRIAINVGPDSNEISLLWNTPKSGWTSLGDIKSLDLIWDGKEYEQITVDQIKTYDYVVFNGHIFQVCQAMQPFVSIAVDSIVMYARLDKSMISTALRRRNGESS